MKKGFEEAFMDAQSRNIALCIDLLQNSDVAMDKAFVYMYQSDVQDFYNAFFEKNGRIYRVNELFTDEQIDQFFNYGIDDIENIAKNLQKIAKDGKIDKVKHFLNLEKEEV